jgi:hypothetical protein
MTKGLNMHRKIIAFMLALVALSPAYAADNFLVKDATGATIAKASKDLGAGVQSDKNVLVDSTGTEILGLASGTPGANTINLHALNIDTSLTSLTRAGGSTTSGSNGMLGLCAVTTSTPSYTNAQNNFLNCQTDGRLRVSDGAQATAGSAAGTLAKVVAGTDGTNARILSTSTGGVLDSPRTGACDSSGTNGCKLTKTLLATNTVQQICPATANIISQEIYFTTGGVGISLSGDSALASATVGTGAHAADLEFDTGGVLYPFTVPQTNAIYAYGAAGVISCIQKTRT